MNTIITEISTLLEEKNIPYKECMLTGSFSCNKNNDHSDIDIFLLSDRVNNVTVESHVFNNRRFELILFPYHKTHWLLLFQQMGKYKYLSMFEKGKVLPMRKNSILGKLDSLKNIFKGNCMEPNNRQILYLRHRITDLIDDIDQANSYGENLLTVCEIVKLLSQLATSAYDYSGRHLAKELSNYGSIEACILKMVGNCLPDSDFELIKNEARNILSMYGGLLYRHSTNYSYDGGDGENGLFIQIEGLGYLDTRVSKILYDLTPQIPNSDHVIVFYVGNNQMLERGTYIHISCKDYPATTNILNGFFLRRIDWSLSQNIRFSYPYQIGFDVALYFGGQKCLDKLFPLFQQLSRLIQEDLWNCKVDHAYLVQLGFAVLFSLKSGFGNKLPSGMFLHLAEKFQCEAIDVNQVYNTTQLKTVEKAMRRMHRKYFLAQKTKLEYLDNSINASTPDEVKRYIDWGKNAASILRGMPDKDILYDPIFIEGSSVREQLYEKVFSTILSILGIEPHEKYSIFFMLSELEN
ncbi:MAG: hypothetical protein H6Q14_2494 [Bacteroidetes bacterium]|nr:hypothetical protein [Bacteroidota bacterium]